jgi:hypothetical protein
MLMSRIWVTVQQDSKRAANSISSRNWRDSNHFQRQNKDVIGAWCSASEHAAAVLSAKAREAMELGGMVHLGTFVPTCGHTSPVKKGLVETRGKRKMDLGFERIVSGDDRMAD